MAASGESGNNSPQDFPVYDIGDDDEPIEEPQQEHKPLETTASASAQPIPGTVTPIIGDTSGNDVSETVSKILQSMGVPTYASTMNVLADDLASFPLEKSLLYMRQIRKYMDEKLVESESSTFNSEDDTNIG
uniref:Uncharacterized protein n=1 Tax=Parascaris equorum TaxID=6256 RepID=A0A914S1V6_PAREQ